MANIANQWVDSYVAYVGVVVSPFSDVPVYLQVAAILRDKIAAGELAHLDRLPSESALAQTYEVGRDTVRHAIAVLRDEGLVFTVAQRGTFVGPRPA
jgi:DNA-binding GntR family transcriptional regulator